MSVEHLIEHLFGAFLDNQSFSGISKHSNFIPDDMTNPHISVVLANHLLITLANRLDDSTANLKKAKPW